MTHAICSGNRGLVPFNDNLYKSLLSGEARNATLRPRPTTRGLMKTSRRPHKGAGRRVNPSMTCRRPSSPSHTLHCDDNGAPGHRAPLEADQSHMKMSAALPVLRMGCSDCEA